MAQPRRPVAERFWKWVDKNGPTPEHAPELGPCWCWTGSLAAPGYGHIGDGGRGGKNHLSHRWLWEHTYGPVPEGLELDHLCRDPGCVNPDHLEPVSHRENLHRSPSMPWLERRAKTHCIRGHEFTPENTIVTAAGYRRCRACKRLAANTDEGRARQRENYARRRGQ